MNLCPNYKIQNGFGISCGKCTHCQQIESWRWAQRVKIEMLKSEKNWFVTLTYRGLIKPGYDEIQKMVKRLRKKHTFRYLCVAEEGSQKGRLHYHMMVHGDLTKREVLDEWKHGFKSAKLADNATDSAKAAYISKYVSKQKTKTKGKCYRASIGYGKLEDELKDVSIIKEALKYFPKSRVHKVDKIKVPYKFQYTLPKEKKEQQIKQNGLRRAGTY